MSEWNRESPEASDVDYDPWPDEDEYQDWYDCGCCRCCGCMCWFDEVFGDNEEEGEDDE